MSAKKTETKKPDIVKDKAIVRHDSVEGKSQPLKVASRVPVPDPKGGDKKK